MSSLTACLRKFGKAISPQDRAAIERLAASIRQESGIKGAVANKAAALRAVRDHAAAIDAEIEALRQSPPPAPVEARPETTGQETPEQQIGRVADAVVAEQPDLQVMMEGMDEPMSAADLIAQVRAEAAQEVADSRLVQVAAECALRG